jgi:hypothetical protein
MHDERVQPAVLHDRGTREDGARRVADDEVRLPVEPRDGGGDIASESSGIPAMYGLRASWTLSLRMYSSCSGPLAAAGAMSARGRRKYRTTGPRAA